jgi:pimeloyl-ACP methyl ester carboxylesterase
MLTSDYAASFDGTLIHYQVNRRPKNPTLVFIHGAGSNHTAWARITPRFKNRSYIAVDLRNHGLSGFGKFSIENVTRDIAEVLAREHVKEFIPVGMSLGAPVALELVKRFPDKAKRVVLISPSSRSLTNHSAFFVEAMRTIRGALMLFPKRNRLKFVRQNKKVPAIINPFWEMQGIHVRDMALAIERALTLELDFTSLRKPTLILTGRNDLLMNRRALNKILRRNPHIAHESLPAHHLILSRAPSLAAERIAAFAED